MDWNLGAYDGHMEIRMTQSEAQHDRRAAFPLLAQLVQLSFVKLAPCFVASQVLTLCDASTDDGPGTRTLSYTITAPMNS